MASKKDKFGKKVRSALHKKMGDAPSSPQQPQNMPDLIQNMDDQKDEIDLPLKEPEEKIQEKSSKSAQSFGHLDPDNSSEESMSRNRDTVYNVSTDIRLDDYTEDNESGRDYAGIARLIGGLLLIASIAWGIYSFSGLLFGPNYQMAITNEEVDESVVAELNDRSDVVLSAQRPVFIRFQWEPGDLESDYLRIRIISIANDIEVAEMGRLAPVSVNYILFAGPLEKGKYKILVEDRNATSLLTRNFTIR